MSFVLPGVVRIPPRNSFEEGAMLEPVNTVLKAVNRLTLLPGDTALVAGQGPIGLMFTRLLQLRGVNVLATDLMASRLKLARKFGARWTLAPSGIKTAMNRSRVARAGDSSKRTSRGSAPLPFDAAVLAVPSDAALQQAVECVRGAGQVLLFAHTRRGVTTGLDLAAVCVDEKDLLGSYSADFTLQGEVARVVFSRRLDVRGLITHRFPLRDTARAVQLASRPTSESLKVLVCPLLAD
jgi:L-iditol 2-dehydrogenase